MSAGGGIARTVALLVAVGAGWLPIHAAEETPRPIEALAEQLAATDKNLRRQAAYELNSRASEARPALPALIKALDDPDKQVWAEAVSAIAKIGPDAKEAIPALLGDLETRNSRGGRDRERRQALVRSAYALTRIGSAAIPPLVASLKSDNSGLRQGAAKALGGMGPAAGEAISELIANLGHSDPELRREVIDALAAIGPASKAPLVAAIDGKEPLQRSSAILAIGELGATAAEAAPAIAAAFAEGADVEIRIAVLSALPRLGWDAAGLRPLVLTGIKDDDARVRHAATNVLLTVRGLREQVWPELVGMLKAEDMAMQQHAAQALGALGDEAQEAVPILEALTKEDQPEEVRKSAEAALAKIKLPE